MKCTTNPSLFTHLLGGLEAVPMDLYITFFSLVLSFLGSGVGSSGLLCSSNPMGALGPITGDQDMIGEFSGILECFDLIYRFALPRNSKISRFGGFQLGWGYAMAP